MRTESPGQTPIYDRMITFRGLPYGSDYFSAAEPLVEAPSVVVPSGNDAPSHSDRSHSQTAAMTHETTSYPPRLRPQGRARMGWWKW